METRILRVFSGLAAVILFWIAMDEILDRTYTPDNTKPHVVIVDDDHIERHFDIPHFSLFRTVFTWVDRGVEEYARQDRKFVLTNFA